MPQPTITNTSVMTSSDRKTNTSQPAEPVFAITLVIAGVILLAFSPWQVTFYDKLRLLAQPAIWPIVSLAGIVVFTLFHCLSLLKRNVSDSDQSVASELGGWLKATEYALWFLAYVYIVPITGYLPATLLFCPVLTWRLGYRRPQILLLSLLAGLCIVVIFKGLLQVKIPGGAAYEWLPPAVRNFMIIYL